MATFKSENTTELFDALLIASKMVLVPAGLSPAPEDRERLYQAVVEIENVIMLDKGKLLLELVHRDDLKRIQKLLNKGIKRKDKRIDSLAMQLAEVE